MICASSRGPILRWAGTGEKNKLQRLALGVMAVEHTPSVCRFGGQLIQSKGPVDVSICGHSFSLLDSATEIVNPGNGANTGKCEHPHCVISVQTRTRLSIREHNLVVSRKETYG